MAHTHTHTVCSVSTVESQYATQSYIFTTKQLAMAPTASKAIAGTRSPYMFHGQCLMCRKRSFECTHSPRGRAAVPPRNQEPLNRLQSQNPAWPLVGTWTSFSGLEGLVYRLEYTQLQQQCVTPTLQDCRRLRLIYMHMSCAVVMHKHTQDDRAM